MSAELGGLDDAFDAFRVELDDHHGMHGTACITPIVPPVVVAELLALADRAAALTASAGARYGEGFDAAIGEVRELIADRLDRLGVKVEEL